MMELLISGHQDHRSGMLVLQMPLLLWATNSKADFRSNRFLVNNSNNMIILFASDMIPYV
jgi:hypothetical protein